FTFGIADNDFASGFIISINLGFTDISDLLVIRVWGRVVLVSCFAGVTLGGCKSDFMIHWEIDAIPIDPINSGDDDQGQNDRKASEKPFAKEGPLNADCLGRRTLNPPIYG